MLADQPAEIFCSVCSDAFCKVCFSSQHRKGSRKRHAVQPLGERAQKRAKVAAEEAHNAHKHKGHQQVLSHDVSILPVAPDVRR
jgi:hypothetical protein